MPHFTYNASALGVGGTIERGNVITTIPSLASVALAPTGGEGKSIVSNYYSEELEFSHAETRVFGRETRDEHGERRFTTFTYVLLKNVRIFDQIRIAEMGSTVTSTRGLEDDDDHPFEYALFYRGVRINNRDCLPKPHLRLAQISRYAELQRLFTADKAVIGSDVQTALARSFNGTPEQLAQLVQQGKPVQGSLVESIEGLGQRPVPPVLFLRGLGTVRFGEFMIKPGRRRLNLLRINFGKKPEGQVVQPQGEGVMPEAEALMFAAELMEETLLTGPDGGALTMGSGEGNGIPIGP